MNINENLRNCNLDPSIVRILMTNKILTIEDLKKDSKKLEDIMDEFQYKLFKMWLKKNNLQL